MERPIVIKSIKFISESTGVSETNTPSIELNGDECKAAMEYIDHLEKRYEELHASWRMFSKDKNEETEKYRLERNQALGVLKEAQLQIEYLQDKFKEIGSGNQVLQKIKTILENHE